MPELWIPSGGTNRKIKELYIPSGGVNRKIKEAYAPSGGVTRKIFSGGVGYSISTSDSTTSDWAGSTFTLNSNASGRMYAFVASGGYYSSAEFSMKIDFDTPILKSDLPGGFLFRLIHGYNKARLASNIAASIHINNSNNNTGNSQSIATKSGPDTGTDQVLYWNIADIASYVTSISRLELRVQADIQSSRDYTGYFEITWNTGCIWLINNWLTSVRSTIQL